MRALLKALGWLAAFALIALVCVVLTWYYAWEWWVGLALFVLVCGILFGFGWIRRVVGRLLARRRGDAAQTPRPAAPPAPGRMSDLLEQWKKGLATLKASSLARTGNPVYALPWVAALGTPGSGKSTAMQRARLASAIQETSLTGHMSTTHTLQWWFFDRAVVLDLSGRYCALDPDAGVQDEWKRLLSLIARTRRREPLNGVVVAIGADELIYGAPEKLAEHARAIRNRIDQLMRATDTRFPVYVLVTKCDGLFGLEDWAQHLPPGALRQAMGYVHPTEANDAKEFLQRAFASVDERLRDLRLGITREVEHANAGLLLFPNEFERLRAPLESALEVAFGEDPYTETPMLRGLFFTSAAQGGGVSSYVLKDTNLPDQTVMLMVKEQSLFLQDVFNRVIPQDRWLHRPLGQAVRWERHTYTLGLAAWVLLALGLAGVLTASFVRSWTTIADLRVAYSGVPELSGRLPQDVNTLTRHLELLDGVEKRTSDWLTRTVPFNDDVLDLERRLRYSFLAAFRKHVLAAIDERVARRINPVAGTGTTASAADVQFIVRRLNLVRAAAEGRTAAELARLPDPVPDVTTLARVHGELSPYDLTQETPRAFANLYRRYLDWASEGPELVEERKRLENWLVQLTATGDSLSWLPQWADEQPGLRAVTLAEFWTGSARAPEDHAVSAGYTRKGKQAIDRFLDEIASSVAVRAFAERRAAFEAGYRKARLERWLAFADGFEQGKLTLASEAEWAVILSRVGGERDPHIALLARLTDELADVKDEDAPEWLRLVRRLENVRAIGKRDGLATQARRVTGAITRNAPELARETTERGIARGKSLVDTQLDAGHAFGTYTGELEKAAKEAQAGAGRAAQVAAAFHQLGEDPAVKESALVAAHAALNEVKRLLAEDAGGAHAIWEVAAGSLTFVVQYVEQQAGCTLQSEWEKSVVAPLQGAPSAKDASEMLYGAKGAIWTFMDGPAKPFVRKEAQGYAPGSKLGFHPQLDGSFLPFVNRAAARQREIALTTRAAEVQKEQVKLAEQRRDLEVQSVRQDLQKRLKELEGEIAEVQKQQEKLRAAPVQITVHALPTHSNPGAKAHPYATLLTVQCAPEPRTMTNYNFPVNASFTWNAQTCGDVTLSIRVENLDLTRVYPGARGMIAFATEFRDGERVFGLDDFPGQRAALDALAIKTISVRFQLGGHQPLLKQSDQLADLAKKEADLTAERRKLASRTDAVDHLTLREKDGGLVRQQQDLAEKERSLTEPPALDGVVPRRVALCWKPDVEWLLTKVPTREIPPLALKPAPPAPPAPAAQPAPRPQPAAQGDFQIQLGAFGPEHTQRIVAALKRDGIEPDLQRIERAIEPWYRVRVGRYHSHEEAERDLGNFNERYRVSGAVVRHDPAFRKAGEMELGGPAKPAPGKSGLAPGDAAPQNLAADTPG